MHTRLRSHINLTKGIGMAIFSRRTSALALDPDSLSDQVQLSSIAQTVQRRSPRKVLTECSNPKCDSGWLHLLRSRSVPVFEGGWNCSAECTQIRLEKAIQRERSIDLDPPADLPFRVPLGTLMLQKGWISKDQLEKALEGQQLTGNGRLGEFLREEGVNEQFITRALGIQRNCPVLASDEHDPYAFASLIPKIFVETFGALPMRLALGKILYLGFEDRLDPLFAEALGRMHGFRVENGIVQESSFRAARKRMLEVKFPSTEVLEAVSEEALARSLTRAIERAKPLEAKLVRVNDFLWLRMWRVCQIGPIPPVEEVQDVICSIGV